MIRLRPYKKEDADTIISWSQDERAFYQWSAGVMGDYPITKEEFGFVDSLIAFTAFDEDKTIGFFTLRNPGGNIDELRIGFVILNPELRGHGKGKEMLKLALKYAFEIYGAKRVSLGVFENNEPAYYCYKAAGFEDVAVDEIETYQVLNEEWR
jgi:RimJ/RimL family protein N-acetyltransferase